MESKLENDFFLENIETISIYTRTFLSILFSLLILVSFSIVHKFLLNRNTIFLTFMLPPIILLVTQTISTSLYLSLGLIGALSIVRYRTPVKNQFELGYLFSLIAIGIIAGVNIKYAIFLTFILILIPVFLLLISSKIPQLDFNSLRYNSDRAVDTTITIENSQVDEILEKNKKGALIRMDNNYENSESFIMLRFDDIKSANYFIKSLSFKPKNISITGS